MIQKLLSALAVLSAASVSLTAQESSALRAEIRMLAFNPDLQQKEAYAHDPVPDVSTPGVSAPIKTYLNHEFSTVTLKSRKIVFTTKADRGSMKNEADVIGEVTLPEGANSAILLCLPGKAGEGARCRFMAINDSKKAFPVGSFHATNLSALPVKIVLEKKAIDFKPGQVVLIEDPPVGEGGQTAMRTFVSKNNAWVPVSTGLWPHPGQARSVLILFQNAASGNIQLRAFDDVPPRTPPAAAARTP